MCHPYFLINSMDKRSRKLLIPCQNRRIKYAKELACTYWSAKIAAEINLPHVLSINNFPSQSNLDKIKETLSLRFLGLRRSRRPLKQKKKKKRGYYSAILTEKAWAIRVYHITKHFALVRIKTELFISRASKESRKAHQTNKKILCFLCFDCLLPFSGELITDVAQELRYV